MKAGIGGWRVAAVSTRVAMATVAVVMLGNTTSSVRAATQEVVSYGLRQELFIPISKWVGGLGDDKNEFGNPRKRAIVSKTPLKVDDNTYTVTAHINTARADDQLTERYLLTVKRDAAGKAWALGEPELKESYVGRFRESGAACRKFDKLSFQKEGLTVSGTNGTVCEIYLQNRVTSFGASAADLKFNYAVPEYATQVHTGHDFYAMQSLFTKDHSDQLNFAPAYAGFECDFATCDELATEIFTGLERVSPEKRQEHRWANVEATAYPDWFKRLYGDRFKSLKESPFAGMTALDREGHRYYTIYLADELFLPEMFTVASSHNAAYLQYDNWGGFEVKFGVRPKRFDMPDQLGGDLYGYYTKKTLAEQPMYELERRDELESRWYEVHALDGTIELALEDAERLQGDVEFGLTLKQDLRELPFQIISFSEDRLRGANKATLVVNSLQMNGEDLTWVQDDDFGGRVILPERMTAGSKVTLRMSFNTKAILKLTPSYSYVNRTGWMPFVSFGDRIDDFAMTIRSPGKYQILGIGKKVEETREGDVLVSRWEASGVNFPTIIFGKYQSDKATFDAKKRDGSAIGVAVHVDQDSFGSLGITPKYLREIAEQAVNAINVYTYLTDLDYPFAGLNLVNDPTGFLYGQAPSSIIYLGAGVFRGDGELAPYFNDASSISRFKRSVVPHEVGHQWWGNTVSNANDRNYWFVESLAEYFSAMYLEGAFGWNDYMGHVEEWRRSILGSTIKTNVQNASVLFSGEGGFGDYQAAVYNKGPYAFHMLRETFKGEGPRGEKGADARFFEFLKAFSKDLAAKGEIVTLDIQSAAEKALGGVDEEGNPYTVDLGWFFDQWIRGSGIPRYTLDYDVRQAEDNSWIIEGKIDQQIMLGSSNHVLEGQVYRGFVDITVEAKGGPFKKRLVVQEKQTPFMLKVPARPTQVVLNKDGEMLAQPVVVR